MGNSISSTLGFVGSLPATNDQSGFEALNFSDVGKIANIGERGDSHNDIARPADLATGRIAHVKGAADGGTIEFTIHTEDWDDTGQDAVRTACADDAGTGSIEITNPAGDVEYYQGYASNFRRMEKSGESYEGCMFTFTVNDAPVIVESA